MHPLIPRLLPHSFLYEYTVYSLVGRPRLVPLGLLLLSSHWKGSASTVSSVATKDLPFGHVVGQVATTLLCCALLLVPVVHQYFPRGRRKSPKSETTCSQCAVRPLIS